jgi:hypothetical protein
VSSTLFFWKRAEGHRDGRKCRRDVISLSSPCDHPICILTLYIAMNRIFGTTGKKPKPTLTDAISNADTRIDATEVKIRKLDAELARYKDQLKRLRPGPGKVCLGMRTCLQCEAQRNSPLCAQTAVQQRALRVLQQKKMWVLYYIAILPDVTDTVAQGTRPSLARCNNRASTWNKHR